MEKKMTYRAMGVCGPATGELSDTPIWGDINSIYEDGKLVGHQLFQEVPNAIYAVGTPVTHELEYNTGPSKWTPALYGIGNVIHEIKHNHGDVDSPIYFGHHHTPKRTKK